MSKARYDRVALLGWPGDPPGSVRLHPVQPCEEPPPLVVVLPYTVLDNGMVFRALDSYSVPVSENAAVLAGTR